METLTSREQWPPIVSTYGPLIHRATAPNTATGPPHHRFNGHMIRTAQGRTPAACGRQIRQAAGHCPKSNPDNPQAPSDRAAPSGHGHRATAQQHHRAAACSSDRTGKPYRLPLFNSLWKEPHTGALQQPRGLSPQPHPLRRPVACLCARCYQFNRRAKPGPRAKEKGRGNPSP